MKSLSGGIVYSRYRGGVGNVDEDWGHLRETLATIQETAGVSMGGPHRRSTGHLASAG